MGYETKVLSVAVWQGSKQNIKLQYLKRFLTVLVLALVLVLTFASIFID